MVQGSRKARQSLGRLKGDWLYTCDCGHFVLGREHELSCSDAVVGLIPGWVEKTTHGIATRYVQRASGDK
jgi:hypothetical protein